MKLDKLRALLMALWVGGFVLSAGLIMLELLMSPALRTDDVEKLVRNLIGCLLPGIALMTTLYFVPKPPSVVLSPGQTRMALMLTIVFLFAVVCDTALAMWKGTNITQRDGNSFQLLIEAQPVLIGVVAYIFGQGTHAAAPSV